jgi:NADPH-dependent ferric siderophore reductase
MSSGAPADAAGTPPGTRARKPRYTVSVRRVAKLTPRMVRVTFGGEALEGFIWNGPAAHLKLIFAEAAADRPGGESPARPIMRTYTPRRFDAAARELVVDFVIHGAGPASDWAAQASPGQTLTLAGPGRSYAVDPAANWYLLVGDDTAIPAIGTILEALPAAAPKRVLLEVADASEQHPPDAPLAGTELTWLLRGADAARAGQALEAAVRALDWPAGSGRVYVACEAAAMRRIRQHLLHDRGMPREHLVTRGYWKLGETDHPDRDYGEDVV